MKSNLLVFIPAIVLLFPAVASAATSINVSNNGSGATSTVSVTNNVSGSSVNQVSTSGTNTDIRIESNGKVKTYHSSGSEDVNIKSDDGNSSVTINNSGNNTPPPTTSTRSTTIRTNVNGVNITTESTASATPSSTMAPYYPPIPQTFNLFDFLRNLFKSIFH